MASGHEAKKHDMAAALRASLKKEECAVEDKFTRADMTFSSSPKVTESPAAPPSANPVKRSVIRDTFSMPSNDYALIAKLRQRCLSYGIATTKSGIVRAGLNSLDSLNEKQLRLIISQLEETRPGRSSS